MTPNTTQLRFLVIFNEHAGVAYGSHRVQILKFFAQKNIGIAFHDTSPDGSYASINPNSYERIIVVGGDGTVREVANWIIRHHSSTPLGIVPRGSGNVLAHSLDIPFNLEKALTMAVEGEVKKIDVGVINDREYFLLAAGTGIDAMIMRQTSKNLKRVFGVLAYGQGLARTFLNLKSDKFYIKSEEFSGVIKAQSIFVSNVSKFLKFKLHPEAKFNEGLLNVAIITSVNLVSAIKIALNMLGSKYERDSRYIYFKTKNIYIAPFGPNAPMQIDGEVVKFPYLDIKILPQNLSIVTNKAIK